MMNNILYLSRWFPYPPDNGARIRTFHLLASLGASYRVDLISFCEEQPSQDEWTEVKHFCRNVEVVIYRPFNPSSVKGILSFLSPKPRFAVDTFNKDLQSFVHRAVTYNTYDLVIASEIDMAPYAINLPIPVKILEELELTSIYSHFNDEKRLLPRMRKGLTWWKWARYSARLLRSFDGCTVVSDLELIAAQKIAPRFDRFGVIPNGVDTTNNNLGDVEKREADSLIYSGALTYTANYEAVDYFLSTILPLVLEVRPNVKLYITGRTEGVPINRLPNREHVIFTGYVQNIGDWLSRSQVGVVPLLSGGGTRLKILEALAYCLPVVSTSKGAEGLNLVNGRDLIIADDPDDFANAILKILDDPGLRESLIECGRNAVRSNYDWKLITGKFIDYLDTFSIQLISS